MHRAVSKGIELGTRNCLILRAPSKRKMAATNQVIWYARARYTLQRSLGPMSGERRTLSAFAQKHMNALADVFNQNRLISGQLIDKWRVCGQPRPWPRWDPFTRVLPFSCGTKEPDSPAVAQPSDVGSIPIARSRNLDDSIAFPPGSC